MERERELTEVSYEKNLIADSGKIFATDKPLPTQKPLTPPSLKICLTAPPIALKPFDAAFEAWDVLVKLTSLSSGDRVIRKTFSRSKGAVHVRDTILPY